MKTEIIKPEPEFRPIVLRITLDTPADVKCFKHVGFGVNPGYDTIATADLVNKLRAMRDSL